MSVLAAITALMAVGCGDDDGDDGMPTDAGTDMATPPVDMGGDDPDMFMADEDMGGDDEDMGTDVDMGGDEDMGGDVDMFTETDMGPPGGGAATSTQIQAVIDATDGAVTLMIDDALVTYTKIEYGSGLDAAGFFVQAEQTGPALYIAVDPSTLSPEPAVGSVVDFQVTMKNASNGIPHAEAIDSWNVDSTGNDISFLVQDVTAVDLVTNLDDYVSELVEVTGATIEDGFGFAGSGFDAAEITTTGVPTQTENFLFRAPEDVLMGAPVGLGCTLDVGPTPMWRFNADAQVSAWDPADFTVTSCPEPGAGDLVFTEIGYTFSGSDDDLEFIEIHNPSGSSFDIGGCILADENGTADADALTLPSPSLVGPGAYFVIAGSSSEITGDAVLPTALGFGPMDAVSLNCTVEIDSVDWTTGTFPSMDDVSTQLDTGLEDSALTSDLSNWCLTPAGNTYGTMGRVGTPGMANVPCPCTDIATGVVINEVDYDDEGADDHEFVELYNPTGAAVDVSGWTLAFFNGSNNEQYASTVLTGSIAAGGYLVVTAGGSDVTPSDASISGGIQNGAPDAIALFDGVPNGTTTSIVDVVVYEGTFSDPGLLDSTGTLTVGTIPTAMNMSIGTDAPQAAEPDLRGLSRVVDGCDRMMPGRDWGVAPATPGAAN